MRLGGQKGRASSLESPSNRRFPPSTFTSSGNPRHPSSSWKVWFCGAVLLVAGGLVGLMFWLKHRQERPGASTDSQYASQGGSQDSPDVALCPEVSFTGGEPSGNLARAPGLNPINPTSAPSDVRRGESAPPPHMDGSSYVNQEIGLELAGPPGWIATLGTQAPRSPAHRDTVPDGLLVRWNPSSASSGSDGLQVISLVLRNLDETAMPESGLDYLRSVHLPRQELKKRKILEGPKSVQIGSYSAGWVSYEFLMGSTPRAASQCVIIKDDKAYILTALGSPERRSEDAESLSGVAAGLHQAE